MEVEDKIKQLEDYVRDLESGSIVAKIDAARALTKMGEPAIKYLIDALGYPDDDTSVIAADALTDMYRIALDPLAESVLNHKSQRVRSRAAWAMMQINDPKVPEVLWKTFESRDWEVIAQGSWFFIAQGKEGTEDILIDALERTDSEHMAHDFCDCSNPKLEAASKRWANKHGYREWPDMQLQIGRPRWGKAPIGYPWYNVSREAKWSFTQGSTY